MTSSDRTFRTKTIRLTAIGLAATGLSVAGAGLVAAANPASAFGQAVGTAAHDVGIAWDDMPDGYTEAQYKAFWGAGFTAADQEALQDLWDLDPTETKSKAGQLILDGEQLPFEPGTHPDDPGLAGDDLKAVGAFFAAGYDGEDAQTLSELWEIEFMEAKVKAGQLLLDGQELPIDPSASARS